MTTDKGSGTQSQIDLRRTYKKVALHWWRRSA